MTGLGLQVPSEISRRACAFASNVDRATRHTRRQEQAMARGWQFGTAIIVVCSLRQANSFLAGPSVPRTTTRSGYVTTVTAAADGGDKSAQEDGTAAADAAAARVPRALDRSAPLSFIANNNVNLDGDFIASREGEPTAAELANENLIKIVAQKGTDEQVNWLLWKCLGYRYDPDEDTWRAIKVFPRWEEKYPEPIDLVGVTRVYEPAIDKPILRAVQTLTRSVPSEYKRCIVEQLRPLGFSGYKLDELTPNRTRRAQLTNFLLYYRDNLWGVPLEEVERRRVERQERANREEAAKAAAKAAAAMSKSPTDKQ